MASIQPNSRIILFSGIPLDNSYQHSVYFGSVQAQTLYFTSSANPYREREFTTQSYQRVNAGVFEANISADLIYNCNYMCFQNTAYGNKWFYAFITKIEYRNNENAYVYYEIDVLQTYLFDITFKECFIERQHTATDGIGDHILPEPISPGEYVFNDYHKLMGTSNNSLEDYLIGVLVCDTSGTVDGKVYDEVYAGGYLTVFRTDATALAELNRQLSTYVSRPEAIVSLFMLPKFCVGSNVTIPDGGAQLASTYHGQTESIAETQLTGTEDFGDSFIPKNKKLYTYPYNFFHVDNGDGDSMVLRYEFFSRTGQGGTITRLQPTFTIESCVTTPIQLRITPTNYKQVQTQAGSTHIRSEFLTIAGFPLCSWNYDSYKAWQAQNAIPMALKAGIASLSLIAGLATGGIGLAVGAVTALGTASNITSEAMQASQSADICKGNISSGNVNFSHQKLQFYGARARVTTEVAKMADDFFTMYGYKVSKVDTPNIHIRPRYTYNKTIGCKIIGKCPTDAVSKICSIFDSGITFWSAMSEIGDYSVNNAPT